MQADTTDQVPAGSPPDVAYAPEQCPLPSGIPKLLEPEPEAEGPHAAKANPTIATIKIE
jgi:hypothetical protein